MMERVHGDVLKAVICPANLQAAGRVIGLLHGAGIVHGDLTGSNIMVEDGGIVLIDFGLAQVTSELEARGVDLHVFLQTLEAAVPRDELHGEAFVRGYRETFSGADQVLEREREIRRRGRYL